MLYKNEEAFSKAFKEKRENLYLLCGGEGYLVNAWAKRIVKKVCGGDDAFNFQKLDGRKPDIDLLIDACEAMPFGASEKCVLLEDFDPGKLSPGQLQTLEELLNDVNPACVLVITGKDAFDKSSAAGKKIIKAAQNRGAAVELETRGASGLTAFIKAAAKKQGCEISTEVCRYMLDICENSMNHLANETAKICARAGYGGVIAKEHVEAVATHKVEARVFDLSRSILSGNTQRAYEILGNLFYLQEKPVSILSTLCMSYADMYRARVARDEGKSPGEAMAMFGYKSEYRVNTAFSARLSSAALRAGISCLLDCDLKMKSTGQSDRILLEKAVAELFATRGIS